MCATLSPGSVQFLISTTFQIFISFQLQYHTLEITEFHDGELEMFMEDFRSPQITSDVLLVRFREDVTWENVLMSNGSFKRKLHDYLYAHCVMCDKGTDEFIQAGLIALLTS